MASVVNCCQVIWSSFDWRCARSWSKRGRQLWGFSWRKSPRYYWDNSVRIAGRRLCARGWRSGGNSSRLPVALLEEFAGGDLDRVQVKGALTDQDRIVGLGEIDRGRPRGGQSCRAGGGR